MKKKHSLFLCTITFLGYLLVGMSCKKGSVVSNQFTIAYSNLKLSASNVVPVLDTSIHAHAYATLDIMTTNVLYYDIYCDTLPAGDTPNSFALYFGLAGSTGTLVQEPTPITLNANGEVTGQIKLSQAIVDSFSNYAALYMVINSTAHPNGLMRVQISHAGSIGFLNSWPVIETPALQQTDAGKKQSCLQISYSLPAAFHKRFMKTFPLISFS